MNYDELFGDECVDLTVLRQRSFNYRWAEQPEGVLALTTADTDFPVAPEVRAAIRNYVDSGVLTYGPPEGLASFRQVIAQYLRTKSAVECSEESILITSSAASSVCLAIRHLLERGDEIIVFDPVDSVFAKAAHAAGVGVVRCPVEFHDVGLNLDAVRCCITPKTRMIGLCNPHNPLGLVWSEQDLCTLGDLALEHNLWILNDEVWADIVFDPARFVSMASLSPNVAARTLTVRGFSKNFGLAGLRVGFLVLPNEEMLQNLTTAQGTTAADWGAATLSQVAAQAAYEDGGPWLDAFVRHLTRMRDNASNRLAAMPGVIVRPPDGTYVVFPNISAFGLSSTAMAEYLLNEARVAVVAGAPEWFGPAAEGHIRIAFATSAGILNEALDRIEAALTKLS
jgi:cystathionine beta-lyase